MIFGVLPSLPYYSAGPYWNASIDTILAFLFFLAKAAWIRLFGFQAKKISIMVYLIRSKNPCPDGIITVQAKLAFISLP